jgi:hypothetical protein
MPRLCILRMGGMPCRIFISIGKASARPAHPVVHRLPRSDIGHMDEQIVGPGPNLPLSRPCLAQAGSRSGRCRTGKDVRRNLQTELAPNVQAFS